MIRSLTHKVRTRRANRQLGGLLAVVAGAANAGGFLAIPRYTSHMTGIVSEIADASIVPELLSRLEGTDPSARTRRI